MGWQLKQRAAENFASYGEPIYAAQGGTSFIIGNHVIVDQHDGSYALYAHLQRGSVAVRIGDQIGTGTVLGKVGNSGNTSEPHLHFQLMDHPKPERAAGLPFRWDGIHIEDEVSSRWSGGKEPEKTIDGLPANGQIFTVEDPPVKQG